MHKSDIGKDTLEKLAVPSGASYFPQFQAGNRSDFDDSSIFFLAALVEDLSVADRRNLGQPLVDVVSGKNERNLVEQVS